MQLMQSYKELHRFLLSSYGYTTCCGSVCSHNATLIRQDTFPFVESFLSYVTVTRTAVTSERLTVTVRI